MSPTPVAVKSSEVPTSSESVSCTAARIANTEAVNSSQISSSSESVSCTAPHTTSTEICQEIAVPVNVHPLQTWSKSGIVSHRICPVTFSF